MLKENRDRRVEMPSSLLHFLYISIFLGVCLAYPFVLIFQGFQKDFFTTYGSLFVFYTVLLQLCYNLVFLISFWIFDRLSSSKIDDSRLYTELLGRGRLLYLMLFRLLPSAQMAILLLLIESLTSIHDYAQIAACFLLPLISGGI